MLMGRVSSAAEGLVELAMERTKGFFVMEWKSFRKKGRRQVNAESREQKREEEKRMRVL
jgi:hypothetical protein